MKTSKRVPKLPVLRVGLRRINHRILQLLAKRDALVRQVAMRKTLDGVPIVRPSVEKSCFADIRAYAKHLGLDQEFACAMFQLMLGRAYKVEIMHFQQEGDKQ